MMQRAMNSNDGEFEYLTVSAARTVGYGNEGHTRIPPDTAS